MTTDISFANSVIEEDNEEEQFGLTEENSAEINIKQQQLQNSSMMSNYRLVSIDEEDDLPEIDPVSANDNKKKDIVEITNHHMELDTQNDLVTEPNQNSIPELNAQVSDLYISNADHIIQGPTMKDKLKSYHQKTWIQKLISSTKKGIEKLRKRSIFSNLDAINLDFFGGSDVDKIPNVAANSTNQKESDANVREIFNEKYRVRNPFERDYSFLLLLDIKKDWMRWAFNSSSSNV